MFFIFIRRHIISKGAEQANRKLTQRMLAGEFKK